MKHRNWLWSSLAVGFIILAALFAAYLERPAIYNALNAAKLIPQPERFTELYFENSSALPSRTIAGQPLSFAFTVHNLEGTSTVYPYEAYFEYTSGDRVMFQRSSVQLADGASTTVAISHTFLSSGLEGELVVNLTSLNQSIDFLLGKNE